MAVFEFFSWDSSHAYIKSTKVPKADGGHGESVTAGPYLEASPRVLLVNCWRGAKPVVSYI